PSGTVNSSTVAGTGAIAVNSSFEPFGALVPLPLPFPLSLPLPLPLPGAARAPWVPARPIASAAVEPPSTVRRDRALEAMSRNVGLCVVLHSPKAHWLAHLSWQVTAERLPRTESFMSRVRSSRAIRGSLSVVAFSRRRSRRDEMTMRHRSEASPSPGGPADEHSVTARQPTVAPPQERRRRVRTARSQD